MAKYPYDENEAFKTGLDQLKERRDVFLGYCSKARDTANAINLFLTRLKVSPVAPLSASPPASCRSGIPPTCG